MLIGYARVSTQEQNLDRQIDSLEEFGCEKIFLEKVTGTKIDRTELNKLLEFARKGDIVVVLELTRLSRSTKDLFTILENLESKGIHLKSIKEAWLDTSNAQGRLLYVIFAGLSQFERDLTQARVKEGLASARARGRCGGRPRKRNEQAIVVVEALYKNGVKIADIVKQTALSRSTINRIIKEMK